MKYLLFVSIAAAGQFAFGQTCPAVSKEMSKYFEQKNWRAHSVPAGDGIPPLAGFVDGKNNFHIEDMSRQGSFQVKVSVNKKNASYAEFFKYCRSAATKGDYLSVMRKRERNEYAVTLRYLPSLEAFANNPLLDQEFSETGVRVDLRVGADALIGKDWSADKLQAGIKRNLLEQVSKQNEFGVVELNLTGQDDLVCDLIQGKAEIGIFRSGISKSALIEQRKVIDPRDLQTTYQALRDQIAPSLSKEKALFLAGRVTTKLEQERKVAVLNDQKSFEILKALMNPDMSKVAQLDGPAINCLGDQLQEYKSSTVDHVINLKLAFPSLDEIEGEK